MTVTDTIFSEGSLRVEQIIHLASSISEEEFMSRTLEGALDDDYDELGVLLGFDISEDMFENACTLANGGKKGFLVQVSTPVPTFIDADTRSYSWGHIALHWVYSEDLEGAYIEASEWQEQYLSSQKERQLGG